MYLVTVLVGEGNVLSSTLSVVVVGLKLLAEVLNCKVVVVYNGGVIAALRVHNGGERLDHSVLGKADALVVVVNYLDALEKSLNSVCCKCNEVLVELLLLVLVTGLSTVLIKTNDLGRVDGRAAVVCGIEINVEVEEYVLHGKRAAVGELEIVLKNESVDGFLRGAVLVVYGLCLVVKNYARLVLTVCYLTVLIGAEHADLGHTNNGSVRSARGIEGIEYAVQLGGREDKSCCFVVNYGSFVATARDKSADVTDKDNEGKRK